ncbi:ATP-grasp domain-containing protein [Kutzneria sp. NPDC051319]|uniref:ATP-grasp domain-containing protein n=1 Tax=Kutzneria sp. NPDC051319 TaxID=3155047 RepID=UPI00343E0D82
MSRSHEDLRQSVACVSGRRIVDVLTSMDVRTVLLGDPTPLDLACVADVPLDVDLDDWRGAEMALGLLHQVHPIDAVFSVYDAYLPIASYLAARLDVRGLALAAALNCDDKIRMRLVLAGAGVAVPEFVVASEPADVEYAARRLGLPVVVKKATGARGRGTLLCRTPDDTEDAARSLGPGPLLVERFIEGPEYAVQALITDSTTTIVNVLAQHVGPGPRMAEAGYDFPSGLGRNGEREVAEFVTNALRALGFDNGVAHVQVRLGSSGPVLVNVAARPPGGQLCAVTEQVSGIDLTRAAAEIALGRPISRLPVAAPRALYRCVSFEHSGIVDYDPDALDTPGVWLDVDPGDRVRPATDPQGGSYGRIVVYGDDRGRLESDYLAILDSLRTRVHPDNS